MLDFDDKSIKRLNSPKTKTEDKLYLISRFIEEKYDFIIQPNYWDDKFDKMNIDERIFYKIWLWLCYVEWENLTIPTAEFELVYGKEMKTKLESYLSPYSNEKYNLEEFYQLNKDAGKILFEWAIRQWNINFQIDDKNENFEKI